MSPPLFNPSAPPAIAAGSVRATGSPSGDSRGFSSIRNSIGNYTITLDQPTRVAARIIFLNPVGAIARIIQISAEVNATFRVLSFDAAGQPADTDFNVVVQLRER